MAKSMHLTLEVSGCPTTCMHCWARGGPYPAMPFADVEWALDQGQRFCTDNHLDFVPFPMHEMLAHPDAAKILRRFVSLHQDAFEPIATTGVPLAIREDWRDLLAAAQGIGTTTLWFTFHGVGAVHDRAVHRQGAYTETCLAVERTHSAGLRCGCNVFVTKENAVQFDALMSSLRDMGMDEMMCEVATYWPTRRRRKAEASRPELEDLAPLVDVITSQTPFWREVWSNLAAYTEAAYVEKALSGDDAQAQDWQHFAPNDDISVVCRSNLDVYSGSAGNYECFHGNLRRGNPEEVLQKAVERGPVSLDDIYFTTRVLPSVRELAERVGDAEGRRIYFSASEMRFRWLDLALPEYRRY